MRTLFKDRVDAGRTLAARLDAYVHRTDVLVLGLPRGGVPVAFEVAQALDTPLDVFVVRKLGVPGHEELAMGAIASGGVCVLNDNVVGPLRIPNDVIEWVSARERAELERREQAYRSDRGALDVRGHTVILVDDGLATGSTLRAAIQALKKLQPARIVVAVPVAVRSACLELRALVDEVVCVETPEPFGAVGLWYQDFTQTSDKEVHDLLARARYAEQGTP